ncbi:MAG: 1,4-dihydroxy-2-naphthoate polyprenyltransferase [Candidatus Longimicrobiales bacterium M2_2A_002]
MAIRPATLPAAVTPVLVGTAAAFAVGGLRWGPALAALAGALLLQIGANLANDLFDYEKGADTEHRLGPTRVVQSGLLSPTAVRRATALVFLLAALVGGYLAWVGGWVIVAIGLAAIAAAIAYTGGPYPLGYNGLGDIAVFIFFGLVAVCGTAYVQAGYVPALAWIAAVPVGTLITAILVVNNVRDIETDRAAGKRTLAVRLGRRAAVAEYALLLAAAYAVPPALGLTGRLGPWVLLPLVTAPLAVRLYRRVARDTGRALNPSLGGTAMLGVAFGALFALGIVLGA